MKRISRSPGLVFKSRRHLYLSTLLFGLLCNGIYFGFIYRPAPPRPVWQWDSNAQIKALAYAPKTREIWCATGTRIALVSLDSLQVTQQLREHKGTIVALAISPDSTYVASGELDGHILLWGVSKRRVTRPLKIAKYRLEALHFSDDNTLTCEGPSGALNLVNIATGEKRQFHKSITSIGLSAIAYSPNNTIIAAGGSGGILWLWDNKTGTERNVFRTDGSYMTSIAFSPNGHFVAAGVWSGAIYVWDVKTGKQICILDSTTAKPSPTTGSGFGISAIAFMPDNKMIISAGEERTLRLWDVQSGALLGIIPSNEEFSTGIKALLLSPDSKHVFVGEGNTLKKWSLDAFG